MTVLKALIDPGPPWFRRKSDSHEWDIWYAGHISDWCNIDKVLEDTSATDINILEATISQQYTCFALVCVALEKCLAVVDHIRSYPIYYAVDGGTLLVGNDARKLLQNLGQGTICNDGVGEYLLSGYVHNNRTLYQNIFQLNAGEYISSFPAERSYEINCYFRYLPRRIPYATARQTNKEKFAQFDSKLNKAFLRVIEAARDRPVWIPLSGGLDSRLVLCKFLELGYKNIETFSYGVAKNHEMKMAEAVAKQLGVRWRAINSNLRDLKEIFASETRKNYARVADGLHMVPTYLDYEAIHFLVTQNLIPKDAVIINGYSGDFLFGGHIPEQLAREPSVSLLITKLLEKHCSHISSSHLATIRDDMFSTIKLEMEGLLAGDHSAESVCAGYEYWDWRERQTKAVVNGQRVYEYFGLDWLLPLWDKELVDYWSTVRLEDKVNQKFHIEYLKHMNYGGAFDQLRSPNQLWLPSWYWMPFLGKLVELLTGKAYKQRLYELMFYFGYFRNQLGLFGFDKYKKNYKNLRRPRVVPLAAMTHLSETGVDFSDFVDWADENF